MHAPLGFILLQVVNEEAGTIELNILELLMKAGWYFVIPLGILSIIAIYIFVERFLTIKKAAKIDDSFMLHIKDFVSNGNVKSALHLCNETKSPIARLVEKGVMRIGKPLGDISTAIENTGKLELFKLENNLATLATIAGAAPMVGFLGTVTGMIQAFYKMSKAGNNIDPTVLSGGIYQAMLTTALGLGIGIIAYVGYNYLVAQVDKVIFKMEATSVEFIDLLQEPVS